MRNGATSDKSRPSSPCGLRRGSLRARHGLPSRSAVGAKAGGPGRIRTCGGQCQRIKNPLRSAATVTGPKVLRRSNFARLRGASRASARFWLAEPKRRRRESWRRRQGSNLRCTGCNRVPRHSATSSIIGSPSQNRTEVDRVRADCFATKLRGIDWSGWLVTIQRPPASGTGALPTELQPVRFGKLRRPPSPFGLRRGSGLPSRSAVGAKAGGPGRIRTCGGREPAG